ncbi:UV DNA damage repair endonuclease UvsE [Alicyclobacillus acidoterrestris]|uniref:UV DNA damage repair endonuclease UvsE n=1 Tax=Alicyclobacillus acidoterrestris (strain ATCC 49025 / DSM 3922 / CIP 106132 / NCIMB 13137 / GD3B) TaxID=1356854 RepID=T0BHX0_ALIAG|nr:UV DNA damage repair endonuclease UvsE [Alicyclobacillus acidoterrestris]EPZ43533.1 hypothetical protein N007_12555 [Alicyclobacillus acidoterrestris ATCC 49025]UNO50212.1 UV DNA damage repair endonuclease UvsE [Alicyclobacillus acidoterrestris]
MLVRFGFVAMAMGLQNASPSKTMTMATFQKTADEQAALNRILRIAEGNLANTLRILKYAFYEGIRIYRFSSKLIPLYGHEVTKSIDFMDELRPQLQEIGKYVTDKGFRVSFHPDHFTVLNSPKEDVFINAVDVLERHVHLLETMGLSTTAKLNIHVGGAYGDKTSAIERLYHHWNRVPNQVKQHILFENDDKTYTARDTLKICQHLGVPMTLDVHHHYCNNDGQTDLSPMLEDIFATWKDTQLVPKVHMSSPKSARDFRAHADFVNVDELCHFLDLVRPLDTDLDMMIEAKQKDLAVRKLLQDLSHVDGVTVLDGGSIRYHS